MSEKITLEMLAAAEKVNGLEFTDDERELMLESVNDRLQAYDALREIDIDNSVMPALGFEPRLPGMTFESEQKSIKLSDVGEVQRPDDLEDVAFWPVTHLSKLIESKQVSSVELTEMYLGRLKKYNPQLECVVTLTEDLALSQAKRADEEIASGKYRGPLHGIPWGAKDLLAAKNYKTTWGAMPYKNQVIDLDATVVERLEAAGAVLVAKLTLGALAYGDVWFDGVTKSPWNLEDGSSGSSAGPASATAGGLVGFSIGSETMGSIVSPSTRCGTTGLRPTYGRVSRHGAMALSWSMDKLGPICRSVEDCALVFDAIYGPDEKDNTVFDYPFNWDASKNLSELKIGYVKSAFDEERDEDAFVWSNKAMDDNVIEVLKSLGAEMIPIELPEFAYTAVRIVLVAEAAAAFDDMTRSNQDDLMVRQDKDAWPNIYRAARTMPAVEYIQANRVRTLMMQGLHEVMKQVDIFVCPSFGANSLTLTNLTGHPSVVVPTGFSEVPAPASSITFTGQLYGEADALLVAKAFQDATDFHLKHPSMAY